MTDEPFAKDLKRFMADGGPDGFLFSEYTEDADWKIAFNMMRAGLLTYSGLYTLCGTFELTEAGRALFEAPA